MQVYAICMDPHFHVTLVLDNARIMLGTEYLTKPQDPIKSRVDVVIWRK